MPGKNNNPTIKRWTVNLLPDEKTANAIISYADNPMFDNIIKGYRAGSARGTRPFSYPHATSVHFLATEADFKAVVGFVEQWCKENPEQIRAKLISRKPALIDIPKGYSKYFATLSDSAEPTYWLDFNLEKEPFMSLNSALVAFLMKLSLDQDCMIEIINGVLNNHRPHFTAARLDLTAKQLEMQSALPELDLPIDHEIEFTISAGPSPRSGEYHEPRFRFSQSNKCLEITQMYLSNAYGSMLWLNSAYKRIPSIDEILNKAEAIPGLVQAKLKID